jgi:hypothetical protein
MKTGLTIGHTFAEEADGRSRAGLVRAMRGPTFVLALVAGFTGCRHKTATFMPPPVLLSPAVLEALAPPASPPMLEDVPLPEEPPLPAVQRKVIVPRKPAAPETPPPAEVAGVDPGVVAIGSLSAGGDSIPQSQQDARDLITSIQRRLTALAQRKINEQRVQIRKVRRFLEQAQQALNSGDAEGAKTLATKAKLLMDDVEK